MSALDNPNAPSCIACSTRPIMRVQLLGRRGAVVEADDLAADQRRRHQRTEVHGDAAAGQPLEVLVVAGPVHRLAGAGQRLAAGRLRRPEGRRIALADDLAGDALAQVALAAAVDEQRRARLPLHVDEPRADDLPRRRRRPRTPSPPGDRRWRRCGRRSRRRRRDAPAFPGRRAPGRRGRADRTAAPTSRIRRSASASAAVPRPPAPRHPRHAVSPRARPRRRRRSLY